MAEKSIATRGRTLDHAASVYDLLEPLLLLGKQAEYDHTIVKLLELKEDDHVLDLGCGTGVLTRMIAGRLNSEKGGLSMGIDAAAGMIKVARKKRETPECRFEVAAAEDLPFEDRSFDSIVSSLFFHHVPLDLKDKALSEAFRVLRPGGRLIIADMHTPSTFMGWLVSHVSRWFFMQPQIGENIRGVMPSVIEGAGFESPNLVCGYFGYITSIWPSLVKEKTTPLDRNFHIFLIRLLIGVPDKRFIASGLCFQAWESKHNSGSKNRA